MKPAELAAVYALAGAWLDEQRLAGRRLDLLGVNEMGLWYNDERGSTGLYRPWSGKAVAS